MRTTSFLLLLLLAGAAILYLAVSPSAALGGEWQPIPNVVDAHVQGIGKCAVDEQNKVTNCGLRFAKVVSGKVQNTGSTTYLLDVDALRLDGSDKIYQVEVVEQNSSGSSTCKLVSFGPNC
ncbi:Cysteine proteinase inhibitor 5 [Hordeum vulgare]|uniref:Cystatin domain-containing protein n=1 Tax=Hordeum vulgare subsp. vulgare TaxID=112509 RepID=A0A8I6XVT4_HORVV|nr:cysteine proteinase inhibitor 8-like [Hordeum vulgare subsp. vulgare]KAE8799149.1 Cysteine proteinase inhibitor 5 [Hordeum vulgare]